MSNFSIQYRATALCTVDLSSGTVNFHKDREHPDGLLVIHESEKLSFVLDPHPERMEYRIFIGDVPLADILPNPSLTPVMLLEAISFRTLA